VSRLLAVTLLLLTACAPAADAPQRVHEALLRVAAAEDARPGEGPQLDLLVAAAATDPDPVVRRVAVRALGRLERPALVDAIAASLADADARVRAAAALALAQAGRTGDVTAGPGRTALDAILARASTETEPTARGALARALGWMRPAGEDHERALAAVLSLSVPPAGAAEMSSAYLVGVALGLEGLLRGTDAGVGPDVAARLEELAAFRRNDARDADAARVRALALAALGHTRRLGEALVVAGLGDPDADVRRAAIRGLSAVVPSRRVAMVERALTDASVRVAIEATRMVEVARGEAACDALAAAAGQGAPPALRVAALAALASPCPGTAQLPALRAVVGDIAIADSPCQPAAQALRSLARVDPDAALRTLPDFVYHASPFVRRHAAGAAAQLRVADALYALAADVDPNVRTAALEGLFTLEGHRVDGLLREQLTSDDPELLLTAATHLDGSADARATALAALDTFERISATRRETLRDTRLALLDRVDESGEGSLAARLRPYLADYDPVVARRVAATLDGWFGRPHEVAPEPPSPLPLPTAGELRALERSEVVLHVRDLGEIVIRPLPHEALTNSWRFVRLAREGYYDGLTFHRWAANFVIQGGSPGANEHTGDGPFTRDEIGLSHWTGTVGLSTRGRDTGDAQLFVNLGHNTGLDPEYTVFAEVAEGLDVVERVLEGAVIERADVRER